MNKCPICAQPLRDAHVVCAGCGEVLPLRVIIVSEASHGDGFALVEVEPNDSASDSSEEDVYGQS